MSRIHRRDLLIGGALTGLGVGCSADPTAPPPIPTPATGPAPGAPPKIDGPPRIIPPAADPLQDSEALPTRPFGKTGARVTVLGLGGMHNVASGNRAFAIELVQHAYKKGVRFFDSATIYGPSQANIGEALEAKRGSVFLQTKTMSRDRDGALRDLEQSLTAFRSDYIDSWLIHDIRYDHEIDQVLGPNGVLEAVARAKEQGLVRFAGVSCHSYPNMLQRLLESHPFDCTLMAINAAESYDKPFVPSVLPVAVKQELGIIAMKTMGYGNIFGALSMEEALSWALSQPISLALVGMNQLNEVDANTDHARAFVPLTSDQLTAVEAKVKPIGELCTFFRRDGWA